MEGGGGEGGGRRVRGRERERAAMGTQGQINNEFPSHRLSYLLLRVFP